MLLLLILALSIHPPQAQAAKNTKFNAENAKKYLTLKCYKLNDATLDGDEVDFRISFAGAYATTNAWKNYTFRITGDDKNHKDAAFSQNITVQVKQLPVKDGYLSNGLTYQIELQVGGKVANVVEETEVDKRTITSRLYAICNGLFAGYVKDDSVG